MKNAQQYDSGDGGEIYYNSAAVRGILGISRTTLWRMFKRGLRTVRIGGVVRIRKTDLHRFLAEHENGTLPD